MVRTNENPPPDRPPPRGCGLSGYGGVQHSRMPAVLLPLAVR